MYLENVLHWKVLIKYKNNIISFPFSNNSKLAMIVIIYKSHNNSTTDYCTSMVSCIYCYYNL